MKNILITGGAGFIGSNVAPKLIAKGYNVTVLDSLSKQIHGENPEETSPLYFSIKDKVNFIKGSVTSREDWMKALEGQDAVIHLAAETGTGQSMYEIEKYVQCNIGGTALLLADTIKDSISEETYYVHGRDGHKKRDKNEIGIHAVRGGSIVGDHDVIFAGTGEVIELSHKAISRDVFAIGALKACEYMATINVAGLYNMDDVLGL